MISMNDNGANIPSVCSWRSSKWSLQPIHAIAETRWEWFHPKYLESLNWLGSVFISFFATVALYYKESWTRWKFNWNPFNRKITKHKSQVSRCLSREALIWKLQGILWLLLKQGITKVVDWTLCLSSHLQKMSWFEFHNLSIVFTSVTNGFSQQSLS